MVTHTLVPYEHCERIGAVQAEILDELTPPEITDANQVSLSRARDLLREKMDPLIERLGVSYEGAS